MIANMCDILSRHSNKYKSVPVLLENIKGITEWNFSLTPRFRIFQMLKANIYLIKSHEGEKLLRNNTLELMKNGNSDQLSIPSTCAGNY